VVGGPLTRHAARNQQQPLHAGQRAQGLLTGVVRLTHLHPATGEVGSLAPGAHDGHHIRCGHATGQQLLNRETPKMA
jgi:hypothetical protein